MPAEVLKPQDKAVLAVQTTQERVLQILSDPKSPWPTPYDGLFYHLGYNQKRIQLVVEPFNALLKPAVNTIENQGQIAADFRSGFGNARISLFPNGVQIIEGFISKNAYPELTLSFKLALVSESLIPGDPRHLAKLLHSDLTFVPKKNLRNWEGLAGDQTTASILEVSLDELLPNDFSFQLQEYNYKTGGAISFNKWRRLSGKSSQFEVFGLHAKSARRQLKGRRSRLDSFTVGTNHTTLRAG